MKKKKGNKSNLERQREVLWADLGGGAELGPGVAGGFGGVVAESGFGWNGWWEVGQRGLGLACDIGCRCFPETGMTDCVWELQRRSSHWIACFLRT